jgi:hypothetical protein
MKLYRPVRADYDKPHQCPCCPKTGHRVFGLFRTGIYSCAECAYVWWRGPGLRGPGLRGRRVTCIHHRLIVDLLFLASAAREEDAYEISEWLTDRMLAEEQAAKSRTSNRPPHGGYSWKEITNVIRGSQ